MLSLLASVGAGCTRAQARTEPVVPEELLPPPAPPRVVEYYTDETVLPAEPTPAETPVEAPPPRTIAKPVAPRPDATVKPEPPKIEPERPATPPPAVTLKPVPGSQSATEASIRDLLARAANDLARVNYASLTDDGKAQYDTARRFVQQSEDALKNGNLVIAGKLADKAATMAAVLKR